MTTTLQFTSTSPGNVPPHGQAPMTPVSDQRVHLEYLDGVRGVAAVFVVLYHAWQFVITRPDLGALPPWFSVFSFLKFGPGAVAAFIVLSGYCLMLPVVRSGDLAGGRKGFLVRRARRILPGYFACLFLSIALLLACPALRQTTNTQWDIALPALGLPEVLSHMLLLHNWSEALRWKINPPLWSVALEWQIYFVFALVLAPLWRRFGAPSAVMAAVVIGFLPFAFGLGFASPHMLILFAMGMVSAALSSVHIPRAIPSRAVLVPLAGMAPVAGVGLWTSSATLRSTVLLDIAAGFLVASFLAITTRKVRDGRGPNFAARFLGSSPLVQLGTFSYSLYLIHFPLQAVGYLLLAGRFSPALTFLLLAFAGTPVICAGAYAFYRAFELPFLSRSKRITHHKGT